MDASRRVLSTESGSRSRRSMVQVRKVVVYLYPFALYHTPKLFAPDATGSFGAFGPNDGAVTSMDGAGAGAFQCARTSQWYQGTGAGAQVGPGAGAGAGAGALTVARPG
eukprot:1640324-Rhodomonas_salina.1